MTLAIIIGAFAAGRALVAAYDKYEAKQWRNLHAEFIKE